MANKCSALLIDVAGKQDYIFSSNKLKENIGASYIIAQELFGEALLNSIEDFCGVDSEKASIILRAWEKNSDVPFDENPQLELGYIGGGNAMVLFSSTDLKDVRSFVNHYSLKVLKKYPGVQLAFGLIDDFDREQWPQSGCRLNESLNKNRSLQFTSFQPYKTGIAKDCPLSGEGQEKYDVAGKQWVSRKSFVRITKNKNSNDSFSNDYSSILKDKYKLTDEIEHINLSDEKSYVAVVHIDGNGMGQKFREAPNLKELRDLSKKVNRKLETSMEKLLERLVEICDDQTKLGKEAYLYLKHKDDLILPFRSIINAGDDITFVCHGSLGIYLAEEYMKILADDSDETGGLVFASCAGVAIVNKKYPFFRAYTLAEELASAAKDESRKYSNSDFASFLNYHISSTGFTGDFEDLIYRKYKGEGIDDKMVHGPFCLTELSVQDAPFPFTKIKLALNKMYYTKNKKDKWPRNKLLELRQVLTESEDEREFFKLQMEIRNLKLQESNLYEFPYYDMVELIDFYPEKLLKL